MEIDVRVLLKQDLEVSTSGTDADEAGIMLANSGKVGFNDGIQIAHGAGVTTFTRFSG
jgi:hypothetical protein